MDRFISYEGLPLSSGGAHSVCGKSSKEIYNSTIEFLNLYAVQNQPNSIELTLLESEKKEYSVIQPLPKLIVKFGIPKIKNDQFLKT